MQIYSVYFIPCYSYLCLQLMCSCSIAYLRPAYIHCMEAIIPALAPPCCFALFSLIQKVKWFSAQQKLSPGGLSYLCHVKPSGLSL